jgi:hypothetical protein
MELLKHDADILAANARQRILAQRAEIMARNLHLPGCGALQPGHHHQQRGLARSARPDDADRLAAADLQIDAAQNVDPAGAA